MRSNRDNRSDTEREIDDFLSQFEHPADELSSDINSYLEQTDTTKMTAARTFYGREYSNSDESAAYAEARSSSSKTPSHASDAASHVSDAPAAMHQAAQESELRSESSVKSRNKAAAKKTSSKKDKRSRTLGQRLFMKPNPKYDPALGAASAVKPYKFSFGKLILDLVGLGVLCVLVFMIYALACITTAPKYDFSDIYAEVDTSSMIYDDEGREVDSVYYTQNRRIVSYSDMPEELINSFVAIEDKTFWKHHGFNWTRMVGAVLSSLTGNGRISGTSTITQQLSRNVYLADIKSVRSIRRKILEMYYASRIEHSLTKEQIIEAYLNSVYFGYGCYGVDAAARTYFSKDVEDLSLVQCAALAALPQQPDNYALLKYAGDGTVVSDDSKIVQSDPDTIVTNDLSKERRDLALYLMHDQGLITDEEYEKAADKSLNDFIKPTITSGYGDYTYYHEYLVETVIQDLMDQYNMDYIDAERMVYTKGLQIYSTMDATAQKVIAKEFKDSSNFPSVSAIYNTDSEGNMLNNDGEIALYNYNNYFSSKGNFTLSGDDLKINDDGSVVIRRNHNLNIYETEVNGETDYSLEFKNYYRVIDDKLYSIQGGYINIPSAYKSLDDEGNLVVSSDYFTGEHSDEMKIKKNKLVITKNAYSLATPTLQPQSAMVIVGVGTGEVKAMVGGRTFKGQKLLNRALNSRQPGSSIKPLAVYGAALQKSYELAEKGQKWTFIDFGIDKQGTKGWGDYVTVHSSIEDEKCHIENRDWPDNVTNSFSGKNTFVTAIQKSINTCAVKLQLQVGADYSMAQLKKFGITTAVDDESQYANDMNPAALALGAMCQGVEPLEMALAYSAFPGEGVVNTPVCYTKVVDRNGEVILEGTPEKTEAINAGVAFIMTDVLQSVVKANGYIHLDGVQAGGKTGTTNERYDIWFDGFTPSYAASLWIGTDQNVEMSAGSYPCAVLWGKIMNQIPKAITGSYPSQPSNVIQKGGEYFTSGTENGLDSYKSPSEEKKDREKAYKKWLKARESHKTWVIDQEAYDETTNEIIGYEKKTESREETYTESVQVGTDDNGDPIYEEQKKTRTVEVQVDDTTRPIYKVIHHDEKGHWEYDSGYRDGDFKYNP